MPIYWINQAASRVRKSWTARRRERKGKEKWHHHKSDGSFCHTEEAGWSGWRAWSLTVAED